MNTAAGGVPIRTAFILFAGTIVAATAAYIAFREHRHLTRAVITGVGAGISTIAFLDWLIQNNTA